MLRAGDQCVRRRRHADAGARRRRSARCSAAIPSAAGAEVTVECNPDDVTVGDAADVSRGTASTASASACSRWCRTCSRRSVAGTCRPTSSARSRPSARSAIPTFNLDLIYGARGRVARPTGRRRCAPSLDLGAAARVGVRADRRSRARRWPTQPERHPDDDDLADKYELADDAADARPAWPTTRCATGRGPATSAGTTSCTGAGRLPRLRLGGALAPRRPAVVERAHARALHRRGRAGRVDRGGGGDARRRRPGAIEGLQLRAAHADGVPAGALDVDDLPGLVERRRRPDHASPAAVACWPTRCRACAEV